ncbi:hypothetical protein F2Q68_00007882 [Brassica cretica]|uniref:Uncharacterized protein n=1 Tax=Brassica cretica TaxID=69181 RepID=A0A8S9L396_BRACR|nr:hypothetical protein F2Q68_00007882 [Brassica cretica]
MAEENDGEPVDDLALMKRAYTNKKISQIDDGLVREVVTLVQTQIHKRRAPPRIGREFEAENQRRARGTRGTGESIGNTMSRSGSGGSGGMRDSDETEDDDSHSGVQL